MLTIQLFTGTTMSVATGPTREIPYLPLGAGMALCYLAMGLCRSTRKNLQRSLAIGVFILAAALLVSCNGGFGSKPGTLPGAYVVTITGTSGNLHPSTTITLTVQ